jgi:hypothetical protein
MEPIGIIQINIPKLSADLHHSLEIITPLDEFTKLMKEYIIKRPINSYDIIINSDSSEMLIYLSRYLAASMTTVLKFKDNNNESIAVIYAHILRHIMYNIGIKKIPN